MVNTFPANANLLVSKTYKVVIFAESNTFSLTIFSLSLALKIKTCEHCESKKDDFCSLVRG